MRVFRLICYYYSIVRNYYPNFFKRFIHIGLDLFFPRNCLGCQKTGTWLCLGCLESLPRSYSPIEDKIFSVFEYGSPIVKQVIWRLKYKRALELAETLAKPLYDTLMEELEDELIIMNAGTIVLIPTPLSPARRRSRGYNQSEELAKQIARINPEQFVVRADIIKKIKNTPTQVSVKNRAERLVNLKSAFELNPRVTLEKRKGLPSGAIFIIIDDVSTTGATINEIRRLLHLAGVRYVYGLVVAHG